MKTLLLVITCVSGSLSLSCGGQPVQVKPTTAPTVTERIKIDDTVIDSGDYMAVIDPVWWSVSIYDGEQKYKDDLKRFSKEQRYVLAVAWHIAEVNNGGHDQFYSNSTGIVWRDALEGYKAMGLDQAANVVERSADMLGGSPSLDRDKREEQLESKRPNFAELDDEFYKLDLERSIIDYIKHNRSAFYFDAEVQKPKMP